MAKALAARSLQPGLIVGTSVGSINGAVLASAPVERSVRLLAEMWQSMAAASVFSESLVSRFRNLFNHWTHLHTNEPLRHLIDRWVTFDKFEDAYVDYQCVAACIENSSEHWFTSGPILEPILASCALPGVLPPVEVDGLHFIDGGVVNSIPVSRAIDLGAKTIFVLHVGHIDDPLSVPRHPWDVAMVSFEIARRHRFHGELEALQDDVTVHVMPTGKPPGRYNDLAKLRYNNNRAIKATIDAAEAASSDFLDELDNLPS